MCNNKGYMYDITPDKSTVSFGSNTSSSEAEFTGKIDVEVTNKSGESIKVTIKNVVYVKDLRSNLISLPLLKINGFKMVDKGDYFSVIKDGKSIDFHMKYPSGHRYLMGPNIKVLSHEYRIIRRMEMNEKLGHVGMDRVSYTSKKLGINLNKEEDDVCEACSVTKSRRKNLNKVNTNPVSLPGERIYTDISYTEVKSGSGSNYWILSVDEVSGYSWSIFTSQKSDIPNKMIKLLHKIINDGKNIKFIRLDNSGENKNLHEISIEEHMKIKFEFTSRDKPMQNGVVERNFQTLYNLLRATLNSSGLPHKLQKYLWAECASCVTNLNNLCISKPGGINPHEMFYNKVSKIGNELRKFGEIGVVKFISNKFKKKLDNRGKPMIFVGYSLDHPKGTYRMFDEDKKSIVITRDVVWFKNDYFEWKVLNKKFEKGN